MAYINGPKINKILIENTLYPVNDFRIEPEKWSITNIEGSITLGTPITDTDITDHIMEAIAGNEDGVIFNIPQFGTILTGKDSIYDPDATADYSIAYASAPRDGKQYVLTIDFTESATTPGTWEPSSFLLTEEIINISITATTDELAALKAEAAANEGKVAESDEAKAFGQLIIDNKPDKVVIVDANGRPVSVYMAIEPDHYLDAPWMVAEGRYKNESGDCIDILCDPDDDTVQCIAFSTSTNNVQIGETYMEMKTNPVTKVYETVDPTLIDGHILGFDVITKELPDENVENIIHLPKSVMLSSSNPFTSHLYKKNADGSYTGGYTGDVVNLEWSKDGFNFYPVSNGLMEAVLNPLLNKYTVFLRAHGGTTFADSDDVYTFLESDAPINVSGDLTALIADGQMGNRAFYRFFSNESKVVDASELKMHTIASKACYKFMFQSSSIAKAPKLLAKTLGDACYMGMFRYCNSLTEIQEELPATTLTIECYREMFSETAITKAPKLPALAATNSCYANMFNKCTYLTEATELPATTLDTGCYLGMFYDTAISECPELPATVLTNYCYSSMFRGCANIKKPIAFKDVTLAEGCCERMYGGCLGITWTDATDPDAVPYTIETLNTVAGALNEMFSGNTGSVPGSGTPLPNTTYYYKEV